MRTKNHYIKLLSSNPNASVGFTLAAQAIYAARFGQFDRNYPDYDDEIYRKIALELKAKYGETLTNDEVMNELT